MTSPEKLATPDPVIELIEKIAVEWDGCEYDAPGESLDIGDAIRRKGFPLAHALRLATQRQGEGETRDAALEQAANLVECEYAADATQGRRLAQIAQHIRDLKNRKPL